MPATTNQIYLTDGTHNYPCCFLDAGVCLPPSERECFIDIGEGHEPVYARVWMTTAQINALPTNVVIGKFGLNIVMKGVANKYPATLNVQELGNRTLQTTYGFFIHSAKIARLGTNIAVYEILLCTQQMWWDFQPYTGAWNVLSPEKDSYSLQAFGSPPPYAGYNKTYAQIMPSVELVAGVSTGAFVLPFTPVETPQNMVWDAIGVGRVISSIARPLGIHLINDIYNTTSTPTSEFRFVAFDYTDTTESDDLKALASVAGTDGSNVVFADLPLNNIVATTGSVLFPNWPPNYPNDSTSLYIPKYYTIPVWNLGSQYSPAVQETLFVGNHFAYQNTSTGTMGENLTNIANERGARYLARARIPSSISIFAGGYPIIPGKTIRRVRVSMDLDGWFTTVWRHGLYDNPREDWQSKFSLNKAPLFPEHNDTMGVVGFPRDNGSIDLQGFGRGDTFIQLTDYASGNGTLGAGFYNGILVIGAPSNVDVTGNITLPDTGESVGSRHVFVENVPESNISIGTTGSNHWIYPLPQFVTGFRAGTASAGNTTLTLYRTSVPQSSLQLWPVSLLAGGGSDGNATAAPTYLYQFYDPFTGNLAIGTGTDTPGPTYFSPEVARSTGSYTRAAYGTAILRNGIWYLFKAEETPNTGNCGA